MVVQAESAYRLTLQHGVIRLQKDDLEVTLSEESSIIVEQSPERIRFRLVEGTK